VTRSEALTLSAQGKRYGRRTTRDYIRMIYIKKDIAENERTSKALIKFLENKPLNPWTLFSN